MSSEIFRGRVLSVDERPFGSELVYQAPQIANEITNPGAETNLNGWVAGGTGVTLNRDTSVFDAGVASFRIDVPNPGASSDRGEYSITLNAGDTYLFRARMRGSAAGQTQRLWAVDSVSTTLGNHNLTSDGASFFDHSFTFVATANNPHKLRFGRAASFAATASYWLDKAQLVNLSAGRDPGYADGGTAGFGWTGTANASTTRDISHIVIEDTLDFEPDGGNLQIGTEVLAYSTYDETTGLVTLITSMSGTVYPAETIVSVYPRSLDRVAVLDSEDDPDAVEPVSARVPHALYDKLPLGIRDSAPESVEAAFTGDELVITDVTGKAPSIDASFISPGTYVAPPSDGVPPSASPTPTARGAAGWIFVEWDAITNGDPVTYDVHISTTSGFTPDATTLSQSVIGTMVTIKAMPNGAALVYNDVGDNYFIKVVARDQDGAAAASAEASTHLNPNVGQDILAGAITADKLAAVMILTSLLKTADAGQRVEIDPAGIRLYGPTGDILVNVPTDPAQNPTFRGDVITGGLQVLGNAIIQGADNKLDQGAVLTLTAQQADPSTPPTLAHDYDKFDLAGYTGNPFGNDTLKYGLFYDPSGSGAQPTFLTVADSAIGSGQPWRVHELKASDGTLVRTFDGNQLEAPVNGIVRIGTKIWVLSYVTSGVDTGKACLSRFDQSTGAWEADVRDTHLSASDQIALGTDGTNIIVLDAVPISGPSTKIRVQKYDASTGAWISNTDWGGTNAPNIIPIGCTPGPSGNIYIAWAPQGVTPQVAGFNSTTYAQVANTDFYMYDNGHIPLGITYDSTRFWANRLFDRTITKHSTWNWTTEADKYWFAYTWRNDSLAVESKVSPRSSLSMTHYRYSRVKITRATVPTGVEKTRVYVVRKSTTPATTELLRQSATSFIDVENPSPILMSNYDTGGAAPPTSNNFPGGTSTIQSSSGGWAIGGDDHVWGPAVAGPEALRNNTWWFADFFNVGDEITPVAAGTGATDAPWANAATQTNPGIWEFQTGTGTTGYSGARRAVASGLRVGGGELRFGAVIRTGTISDGTNRYTIGVGLATGVNAHLDNTAASAGVAGIFFQYKDSLTSGHWRGITTDGTTFTVTDLATGYTPPVATGTFYRLEFIVNAAGTSVGFYVNGTLAGTATTGIPTALEIMPCVGILKSLGTTSRSLFVDYMTFQQQLTTKR